MPMYFFLSKLSFLDIRFSSTSVPKMLVNIQTHQPITYAVCITQIYFLDYLQCWTTSSWLCWPTIDM
jgi:olfactory receptor